MLVGIRFVRECLHLTKNCQYSACRKFLSSADYQCITSMVFLYQTNICYMETAIW